MDTVVNGATFSFPVRATQRKKLEELLAKMDQEGAAVNSLFPMEKARTLHFATWVIVNEEETPTHRKLPLCLLLITTYDGRVKKHMRELAALSPQGLHQLLLCCENYNENEPSVDVLYKYLKKSRKTNFVYNAYQYTNKDEIIMEGMLHDAIESYLDEESVKPETASLKSSEIRKRIQDFVSNKQDLMWAAKPYKTPLNSYLKLNLPWMMILGWLSVVLIASLLFIFLKVRFPYILIVISIWLAVVILLALILRPKNDGTTSSSKKIKFAIPIILSFFLLMIVTSTFMMFSGILFYCVAGISFIAFLGIFLLLLILLRINERIDDYVDPPDEAWIKKITDKERYPVTNEMNVIGPLKRGYIRPIFLALILWFARHIRAFSYIPTVQTSRWLQLDSGWRIAFIAYFDNTSEGYANDFVDSKTFTRRVNLLFGHGYGFPPTRWALFSGGKDRAGYMAAVRRQGKITNVWYNSHPALSILNIRNNRNIRIGLWKKMSESEVGEWLQLF